MHIQSTESRRSDITLEKSCDLKDRPLGLAELLHAGEPFSEVAVLSETVVVGGQLEQLDLSDHLELLQAATQEQSQPLDCDLLDLFIY